MNVRAVVSLILLPILLLQLTTVELTINLSNYSHGSILPLSLTLDKKAIAQNSQPALLTSHASGTYDQIVFAGDVMLGRHVEFLMDQLQSEYPFTGLNFVKEFGDRTAVVGNFESAMAPKHVPTPAFAMRFSVAEEHVDALKTAGFTHLSLANNHSLDYGAGGYLNAIDKLEETDLKTFGQQRGVTENSVRYLETDHGTVALLGLNATGGNFDKKAVVDLLTESAENSLLQIVYIHWGVEYELTHDVEQTKIAESLVEAGADLIVGHHPHVVQDIEIIDGVPVLYSLGNYVFDQYFNSDVQQGLIVVLEFDPTPQIRLLPVSSADSLSQPQLMTGDKRAEFLYKLAKRSQEQQQNSIKHGRIALYSTVASSPKIAMIKP